jgi:hypothetical protein
MQIGYKQAIAVVTAPKMSVKNGWLVRGNTVLAGKRILKRPGGAAPFTRIIPKKRLNRQSRAGYPAKPEQGLLMI